MARISQNLPADLDASAIVAITDSTSGTVSNTVDDTTAGQADDVATLAAKLNEVIAILKKTGLAR